MSSSTSNGSQPTPAGAIDFLMLLQQLKLTKRTGWVRKNVNGPESIADHMYRMSMMALIATDSGVDVNRCIKMALVHDVAESLVGDITPHCGVSDQEKHLRELAAVGQIKEMLGVDTAAALEVESLWLEYEAASSPEALLVKDFDKLEMIITAFQYEQAQPGMLLEEFFASTSGRFKTATGKAWAAELVARRCKARGNGEQAAVETAAAAAAATAEATAGGAVGAQPSAVEPGAGEDAVEPGLKRVKSSDG
ncbi:hypothetical protein VOLCADRAFT_54922 [Volvox carteri f. nagariensis]|uniref:5'-deoxynucleotidase n=1 Tax=Volvox carteri f. nagariensis TaxID=3068 RepID=D8TGS7_VOLCA|nr:uncharacterized protein VOLCADRAFT_54922 [Volvox carteri f. nagariensis]EFJ52951.1 hypothetical protein VOLCADRAFT_54922 [Volvox carteri f. nagariensis]|eukprot:XP_002945956.1 hypothetical protein VOLCADRAFT_54922 [Volvox carteri f. nagariensis]